MRSDGKEESKEEIQRQLLLIPRSTDLFARSARPLAALTTVFQTFAPRVVPHVRR